MNTKKIVIFGVLAILGAAAGVALPKLLGLDKPKTATTAEGGDGHATEGGHAEGSEHAADAGGGHGDAHGDAHGAAGAAAEKDPLAQEGFVMFDRMVFNLHDPSLTKYLQMECVLVVAPEDYQMVKKLVARKLPLLKDRLTTLVADKSIDDVNGKVGINRLKREIHDEFNRILFPDGVRRIRDVLFDEWHID